MKSVQEQRPRGKMGGAKMAWEGGGPRIATHWRSISCCSWRILLDSMASRFCIRSSCLCSSRCRASASRSRSVMNSSRPWWGERGLLLRPLGKPRCGLPSQCRASSCIATLVVSDPRLRLGRSPFSLLSELQGRRPLGLFWECGKDLRSQVLGLKVRGHGAPTTSFWTYSSSYNGDG